MSNNHFIRRIVILRPGQTTGVFRCGNILPVQNLTVGRNEALVVICRITGRIFIFVCLGNRRIINDIRVRVVNRNFRVTCV